MYGKCTDCYLYNSSWQKSVAKLEYMFGIGFNIVASYQGLAAHAIHV